MLSCNLYNNYFFNWSAFWSTFQKLTIALTRKHFGEAERPNSALHLKPFCKNHVWSELALSIAGSLTLGVWKCVLKDVCPAMFTFWVLLGNDMMDDWYFFSSPLGWRFLWNLRHVSVEKITQHLWRTKESRRLFSVPCSFTWTPVVSGYMRHTSHLVQLKSRLLAKPSLILVMPVIYMNRLNIFSLIQLLSEVSKLRAKNQQTGRRVIFGDSSNLGSLPSYSWTPSSLSLSEASLSKGVAVPCSYKAHGIGEPSAIPGILCRHWLSLQMVLGCSTWVSDMGEEQPLGEAGLQHEAEQLEQSRVWCFGKRPFKSQHVLRIQKTVTEGQIHPWQNPSLGSHWR